MKKLLIKLLFIALIFNFSSCEEVEPIEISQEEMESQQTNRSLFQINFQHKTTIQVGGEGSAEISAYDSRTKKLFVVNVESNQISVFDISNLDEPLELSPIPITSGAPNSVAVGFAGLAVAVEDDNKQNPGKVLLFKTSSQELINSFNVGALPDMVTFTPNNRFIISANEGEPNDDYTIDPKGSISIIDVFRNSVTNLEFDAFNNDESTLEANGFRVFGPGADLAHDVEPEYVTVSRDSRYAWVSLQENNGLAKVDLLSKQIEAIYPLGFKDYAEMGNEIDPSDRDDVKELNPWPVYGIYQPDAIEYINIRGAEYIITANEGDARDYDGFSEEERGDDLDLDPDAFPDSSIQDDDQLGRIKVTTTLGDANNDGLYEEIYNYGARSFSIWSPDGNLVYDSGNDISAQTLALTPDRFNDDDGRSDDKGAEPESVETLRIFNQYILFVGLERNDQIMIYDISNPTSPVFLDILSTEGDEAPEGLLAIPGSQSPNRKELLVVCNEDSGTVTIYQNNRF